MKHADFVHLHVHSHYSLLDGAILIDDLLSKARSFHLPALALTDHGNMFGAIEFYKKAHAAGIKPIIGCEMYIASGSRFDKEHHGGKKDPYAHIILLAERKEGYDNLLKLSSASYLEGFYYRPRIDKELLSKYNKGLIALSACLHGEIPQALQSGNIDKALALADEYRSIFDDGRFYLELQENAIPEQKTVNEGLLHIAQKLSMPLVATNDCHYLNAEDAYAHEVLLCIQTVKTMSTADRMRFSTEHFYVKSPEEMMQAFSHIPEAVKNTVAIAERCNLELRFNEYKFPKFTPPVNIDNDTYFEKLVFDGLEERMSKLREHHGDASAPFEEEYRKRLADEIKMIRQMNFTTYFLIVADFIQFAKEHNIPVGPGRGSAAGSLVAYALKITEIDPIRNGLLFERFLNPERVNPPDIDIDFCMEKRDRVIEYVTEKYGRSNVAQIITFGKMLAKGVIRDVGRALDMPYKEVDAIAKLVPNDPKITIQNALNQEPRLREMAETDEKIEKLISVSKKLEGLSRHASTHAAGVVIADAPLDNYVPLFKGSDNEVVTQYAMNDIDSIGLIKFDFLGLRTLTVINKTVGLIAKPDFTDINDLPLDDEKTYALLSSGETEGIFQLESSGMKELLTRIKPECIEDLTALLALYRPGPLGSGMVDDFIKRKQGKIPVTYELPQLEEVLQETHGVILYQEQVMKIASMLADFSLADADLLRRAMGKKKKAEMARQKEKFLKGAKDNKINKKTAEKIFDLMAKFAEYGFNKSHSAAYAYVAYQTAYLKAHYPVAFMAALLSSEMDNTDKVVKHISECREKNIDVLSPDINESSYDFTVSQNKIRFGLAAVKNVGRGAIESIIDARESSGAFTSIRDFSEKVDLRKVNKKVFESLIKCGAFDSFSIPRSQLMEVCDEVVTAVQKEEKDRKANQISMFEVISEHNGSTGSDPVTYPDIPEWNQKDILAYEKEYLGFYLSGHPLENYINVMRAYNTTDIADILNISREKTVLAAGMVGSLKQITTKKGEPMAFLSFEDLSGTIEIIVFSDIYRQHEAIIKSEHPLIIQGKVNVEPDTPNRIIASNISLLEKAYEITTPDIHVRCLINKLNHNEIEKIKGIITNNPGKSKVYFHVQIPDSTETIISFGEPYLSAASPLFITEIESVLGKQSVSFR